MRNSASLKFCHGSVMFDQAAERKNKKNKIDQTRHFSRLIAIQRKMAYLPVRIVNPGNSAADTMFWYSFRILPDRLKLIRLYPCGSLGPGISFIFGARAGHFAATPQSDVVRICAHDFGVMAMLSVQQKMPFFRAFITLRS